MLSNIKFIHRLSFLIGVLSVLMIIAGVGIYITNRWFRIERIVITGNMHHVSKAELEHAAKYELNGTFFTLNLNRVEQVFKQIPWVRNVIVERDFPDGINIKITENIALARWNDNSFISSDGYIFAGNETINNEKLPIIYAENKQVADVIKLYNSLTPVFSQRNITLDKLYYVGTGLTKLNLSNNLQVVVCGTQVAKRLTMLFDYLPKLYAISPNLNYVNMCYKGAVAISSTLPVLGVKKYK